MFTGIITHLGTLHNKQGNTFTFTADAFFCNRLTVGASVSVNGVCLTVVEKPEEGQFMVTIMPETAEKTAMNHLQQDELVNLELPATSETLLSGHIVQGHIDGIGEILSITPEGNSHRFEIAIPAALAKYIVEKGAIAVNGISLTVIAVTKHSFTVGIIPHTWDHTMLHQAKVGEYVNIETDVLAKYVERLFTK